MTKKGKKQKITGTPDVVQFKSTRTFLVASAVGSLAPFSVSTEPQEHSYLDKLSYSVHLISLLSLDYGVGTDKDYRFQLHHPTSLPTPQFYPSGYPSAVISSARSMIENPFLTLNASKHSFTEDLKTAAVDFLRVIDESLNLIVGHCSSGVKNDFVDGGLKKWKAELKGLLEKFDISWCVFEKYVMTETLAINSRLLGPLCDLINAETILVAIESHSVIDGAQKQKAERQFVSEFGKVMLAYFPEKIIAMKNAQIDDNIVSLSETVLFFEARLSPEVVKQATDVLRTYVELRLLLKGRFHPEIRLNEKLTRALNNFSDAIDLADQVTSIGNQLPSLVGIKKEFWFTKAAIEPELNQRVKNAFAVAGF